MLSCFCRVQHFGTPWTIAYPSAHGILQARMGSHSLLQGLFPTQGSDLSLLYFRCILYLGATRKDLYLLKCGHLPEQRPVWPLVFEKCLYFLIKEHIPPHWQLENIIKAEKENKNHSFSHIPGIKSFFVCFFPVSFFSPSTTYMQSRQHCVNELFSGILLKGKVNALYPKELGPSSSWGLLTCLHAILIELFHLPLWNVKRATVQSGAFVAQVKSLWAERPQVSFPGAVQNCSAPPWSHFSRCIIALIKCSWL